MSIDFFNPDCQETTKESLFGLCDDQNNTKAYVNFSDPKRWVARVENDNRTEVTFTAIDYCIPVDSTNGNQERRCDGMLTYPDNLVLVELKEVRSGGWTTDGAEQLRRTIDLLGKNHDVDSIKKKRAFVANKISPRFQYGQQELMQHFKNETGFRLILEATIKI